MKGRERERERERERRAQEAAEGTAQREARHGREAATARAEGGADEFPRGWYNRARGRSSSEGGRRGRGERREAGTSYEVRKRAGGGVRRRRGERRWLLPSAWRRGADTSQRAGERARACGTECQERETRRELTDKESGREGGGCRVHNGRVAWSGV